MHKILIKNARTIVSCDNNDTIYKNTDILIEGSKITNIENNICDNVDKIIEASDMFVFPGLVNTHHHFFQTFVRNLVTIDYPNLTVPDWLDKIYRIFQLINGDVIFYSSLTALADLVKHGCTTAFDHQYCYTEFTGKTPIDRQMEAAKLLGVRYIAGRGSNTLPRIDGSTMPDGMVETTQEVIYDCERLINKYHSGKDFSMSGIIIAPCQPINSYQETFEASIELARQKKVKLHTHLGEGENQIMLERYGKRSVDWCEDIGFIGSDVFFAHCWDLNDDEFKRLGKSKTGVSHCPTPAVLGGFPIIDIKKLQSYGVNVSLGCDGSATNDGSNLLDAMRLGFMMQSYNSKKRDGAISSYDILKVATREGAIALGRPDIGSLEIGKAADLFMVDSTRLDLTGTHHDPKNMLARIGFSSNVDLTMVNGKVIFENNELIGVDERKLAMEGEKVCTEVLRKNSKDFDL